MNRKEAEATLRLISKAWGRRQQGYCFFPYIDREAQRRTGSRKAGYHEGPNPKNPAFKWPQDRKKIVDYLVSHQKYDLYWCPSLFEYPHRREDLAMDEHALWADLDEIDPSTIDDYPPTIAWESSPGRYQALWLAASGDFQGASWPGNENQKLTYHLGADKSGWDTTQLLRVPGLSNHKLEYEQDGQYPQGKLLWSNGPQYHPGDFSELPNVQGLDSAEVTDALELEIESIDRHKVLARVRLKLNRRIRELLSAREASGDRSDALWEIERSLADVGCSVAEIVAIVRETVWNKYVDRADEMRRLILEASKAISARPEELEEAEDEEIEREPLQRFGTLLKNVKKPKFIIDQVLTEGAVGFIAGEPKCYKSWVALDMALSLATGAPFLAHFRVVRPGPILYIQEEDPLPTLKTRTAKIWAGKATDKLELVPSSDGLEINWLPPEREREFDPDIHAYVQKGMVISDEAWQIWLDEVLSEGMDGEPYVLVIIDTLMMVAGDVDENKSQAMTTQIFKPLKVLARKHNLAFQVVHHMGKSDKPRSGQRLLGSVANHAWSEDSLYLSRAVSGDVKMELESKTAPARVWRISNLNNRVWQPQISGWTKEERPRQESKTEKKQAPRAGALAELRKQGKALTVSQISELTGVSRSQIWRQLRRAEESGKVNRQPSGEGQFDIWELV